MVAMQLPAPEIVRPQPGPQEQFLGTPADIALYGGAAGGGKTFALLLEPLRHVNNPQFGALILRRTTKEVTNVGGLWEESEKLYSPLGAEQRLGSLSWRFPRSSQVKFDHLEHEQDKHKYQGAQVTMIGFDELTRFTEGQFWYLLSRNRSTCGVRPYVRATCNPDADSWVAKLVEWWIDPKTGYPIPERSGVVRWFVRVSGQLHWAATPHELREQHPGSEPKSFTFIVASLDDNPALTERDPSYRANLKALPSVDQERLLFGNWKIRAMEGAEWGPECFKDIWPTYWPDSFHLSAMWIDPSKGLPDGDYGAIVFAGVSGGLLWIDAVVERMPALQLAKAAVDMFVELQPDAIYLEANANQDIAFGRPMVTEAIARGLPPLPLLYETHGSNAKKYDRIKRLNPRMVNRDLRFRLGSVGCDRLESQLRGWPLPKVHDDGPDALEGAIRMVNKQARSRGCDTSETQLATV